MRTHNKNQATCFKRGKTRLTKVEIGCSFAFVGWDGGASFLDQLQSKESKSKQFRTIFGTQLNTTLEVK